jgi:hypothetical protein
MPSYPDSLVMHNDRNQQSALSPWKPGKRRESRWIPSLSIPVLLGDTKGLRFGSDGRSPFPLCMALLDYSTQNLTSVQP